MKRSFINAEIQKFIELCDKFCFKLPPFAFFTPEEWKTKNHEYDEIRDNALGWDLTDFGFGDFMKVGLTLFTLRNGNMNNPNYQKPYAEKIMRVYEKSGHAFPLPLEQDGEDIINRGGETLLSSSIRLQTTTNLARMTLKYRSTDGITASLREEKSF